MSDKTCKIEGCEYATGGICQEGVASPDTCPNLVPVAVSEAVITPLRSTKPDASDHEMEETGGDLVELWHGEALDPDEASAFMLASACRVILVAGAVESGKTTLLTSIYEMFQIGEFSDFLFAGSRTLPAFERRCFHSRTASDLDRAATARTPFDPIPRFLHLQVTSRNDVSTAPRDVLFADLSGEAFRLAKDSREECERMDVLRRADHLVVLVDGEKLVDLEQRSAATDDALLLLRRCSECGQINKRTIVDVLLTKLDIVQADAGRVKATAFWESFKAKVTTRIGSTVGRLSFFETAPRPEPSSSLKAAHGLDAPFRTWVEETLQDGTYGSYPLVTAPVPREFDRFARRIAYSGKAEVQT